MISSHLALLRSNGLVSDRRAGQWIYYQISPELDEWARNILDITAKANLNMETFAKDLEILQEMPNRPGSAYCA